MAWSDAARAAAMEVRRRKMNTLVKVGDVSGTRGFKAHMLKKARKDLRARGGGRSYGKRFNIRVRKGAITYARQAATMRAPYRGSDFS